MATPRIATHADYLLHDMGAGHPESPNRLRAISKELEESGLIQKVELVVPTPADIDLIALNHPKSYIERIRKVSESGGGALDPDTSANAESYRVGLLSAGAVIQLAEDAFKTRVPGFALVRPPGHHAEPSRSMGFCLFNNVAIAAEDLIRNYHAKRIAVIDPDLHHGNGTQASFYSRNDVLYISTHQYPYYPGTGHYSETGAGPGEGFTVNVPLPAGQGDADFFYIYKEVLMPIVREYNPDLILVSAGFDTYEHDPLGGMRVTEQGFAAIFRLMMDTAQEVCEGRIVFALEGGYHQQGLARSVAAVIHQMLGEARPTPPEEPGERTRAYAEELKRYFGQWWKVFRT